MATVPTNRRIFLRLCFRNCSYSFGSFSGNERIGIRKIWYMSEELKNKLILVTMVQKMYCNSNVAKK